ncbi:hypothetical protein KNJ79_01985 [Sphingopyxis indica]|uniref:hypothetical protein n=1 Tax=Sphingopyxis indica TaxID=436663 RepID=UPI00293933F0|nr:hypothetical protein [Sphingopyxis indica]WOF43757.1 hypothetical protein KNJ79_01985 [Sphingopyxis indica]
MLGRVLAGTGALALVLALAWLFGEARYDAGANAEEAKWQAVIADKEREIADLRVSAEQRVTQAVNSYADRIAAIEPVIVRSTDTVTKYAQTSAGSAECLSADRVLGIDADAAALGLRPAAAAQGGDSPLPAIPDPP